MNKSADSASQLAHDRTRGKSTFQALAMAVLGCLTARYLGSRPLAYVSLSLAGVVFLSGWLMPSIFKVIEGIQRRLTRWVTAIVNWVLLGVVYFFFFTPV